MPPAAVLADIPAAPVKAPLVRFKKSKLSGF
jgi:hypothetical protein